MPYPTPADTRYLTTHFLPEVPAKIGDAAVREYLETLRKTLVQQSVSVTASTGGGGANWSDLSALWIAAGAMRGSLQYGPSASCSVLTQVSQGATNAPDLITLNFDPTNQEYAEFSFSLPPAYTGETFTFRPYWSHGVTTVNFGVTWGMAAVAVGDGENLDRTVGTEQLVSDTGGTAEYLYNQSTSAAITLGNSPVAGDLAFFRIYRKPSHASDTLAIDARLHGVMLTFG